MGTAKGPARDSIVQVTSGVLAESNSPTQDRRNGLGQSGVFDLEILLAEAKGAEDGG